MFGFMFLFNAIYKTASIKNSLFEGRFSAKVKFE